MSKISSLCVYCGSSFRVDDIYKEAAQKTGRLIAERGLQLVYGGGRIGLMGLIADAALAAGGKVVGIIPHHLQQWEIEHTSLTELVLTESMHDRKRTMVERSDAFIILPGGFGTLDEAIEVITWKQLHLHDKPIVFVNVNGYWDGLIGVFKQVIESGFAHETHHNLYRVVDKIEDIFSALDQESDSIIGPHFKWM